MYYTILNFHDISLITVWICILFLLHLVYTIKQQLNSGHQYGHFKVSSCTFWNF